MLPDDDKRYAIETCKSSESVLEKWFKIKDIQLVHLLVVWYLVNLQDARCNNKGISEESSVNNLYIAWLYSDVNAKVKVGNKIKSLLHLYTSETNLQNL